MIMFGFSVMNENDDTDSTFISLMTTFIQRITMIGVEYPREYES